MGNILCGISELPIRCVRKEKTDDYGAKRRIVFNIICQWINDENMQYLQSSYDMLAHRLTTNYLINLNFRIFDKSEYRLSSACHIMKYHLKCFNDPDLFQDLKRKSAAWLQLNKEWKNTKDKRSHTRQKWQEMRRERERKLEEYKLVRKELRCILVQRTIANISLHKILTSYKRELDEYDISWEDISPMRNYYLTDEGWQQKPCNSEIERCIMKNIEPKLKPLKSMYNIFRILSHK